MTQQGVSDEPPGNRSATYKEARKQQFSVTTRGYHCATYSSCNSSCSLSALRKTLAENPRPIALKRAPFYVSKAKEYEMIFRKECYDLDFLHGAGERT